MKPIYLIGNNNINLPTLILFNASIAITYKQEGIALDVGKMAGVLGFEPRSGEIKTRCLTAWLYPNREIEFKWCG